MRHWTSSNNDAFIHAISTDFVAQIEDRLEVERINRKKFARLLHVSPGRVSQTLNDPSGFNLRTIVNYAHVLGLKVSIVTYEDDDPSDEKGPISADVFTACWRHYGRPSDLTTFSVIPPTQKGVIGQSVSKLRPLSNGNATETREIYAVPIQAVIAQFQKRYNTGQTGQSR